MNKRKIPTVRIGRPSRRPFQLRYTCPVEDREVRISTKTRDECEAERQKKVTVHGVTFNRLGAG